MKFSERKRKMLDKLPDDVLISHILPLLNIYDVRSLECVNSALYSSLFIPIRHEESTKYNKNVRCLLHGSFSLRDGGTVELWNGVLHGTCYMTVGIKHCIIQFRERVKLQSAYVWDHGNLLDNTDDIYMLIFRIVISSVEIHYPTITRRMDLHPLFVTQS